MINACLRTAIFPRIAFAILHVFSKIVRNNKLAESFQVQIITYHRFFFIKNKIKLKVEKVIYLIKLISIFNSHFY